MSCVHILQHAPHCTASKPASLAPTTYHASGRRHCIFQLRCFVRLPLSLAFKSYHCTATAQFSPSTCFHFVRPSCSTFPRPVSSCLEVFLEDAASSSTEVSLSASGAPPPPLSIQIQYSWRCFVPFPTHQPPKLFTSASPLATHPVRCASRFSQEQH